MHMIFEPTHLIKSPTTPTAVLLYGIVFGFAMWSDRELQWQRNHTKALWGVTAAGALGVVVHRLRSIGFSLRLNILFRLFTSVGLYFVMGLSASFYEASTSEQAG